MKQGIFSDLLLEGEKLLQHGKLGLLKSSEFTAYRDLVSSTLQNPSNNLSELGSKYVEKTFSGGVLPERNGYIDAENAEKKVSNLMEIILEIIKIESGTASPPISGPEIPNTTARSKVLDAALDEARKNLSAGTSERSVDRLHTALHEYLKLFCEKLNINTTGIDGDPSRILSEIQKSKQIVFTQESERLFGQLISIVGTFNTIRNNLSLAHPNGLASTAESILFSNIMISIVIFLDTNLKEKE